MNTKFSIVLKDVHYQNTLTVNVFSVWYNLFVLLFPHLVWLGKR